MKKETGKYLAILLGIICLILAIILIYVKVMAADNKATEKDLNSKIEEEIKYLDSNIINIMNKLNNITVINYKVYTREINDSTSSSGETSGKGNSSSSMQEGNSESRKLFRTIATGTRLWWIRTRWKLWWTTKPEWFKFIYRWI